MQHDPDRLENALAALSRLRAPPPSNVLDAAVRRTRRVRTRVRARAAAWIISASAVLAAAHAWANGLRGDLSQVSLTWLVAVGAAWLMVFLGPLLVIVLPPRRTMLVPARRAWNVAVLAPVAAVALALFASGAHAEPGILAPATWARIAACLFSGIELAVVPFVAAAVAVRVALPLDARAVGAAIGAAGGALGALALHLQCDTAGALHAVVGHGGAVVLSSLLGARAVSLFGTPA